MKIDEDAIRERTRRLWEAEGRPPGKAEELWHRARAEIEREFQHATGKAVEYSHRLNPPLDLERALDPAHRHD